MSKLRRRETRAEKLNLGSLDEREWMLRAACRGMNPAIFFGDDGDGDARGHDYRDGRGVCATCPVAGECRAHALRWREPFGLWGDTSPKERRARNGEVREMADHCERCGATFTFSIAMTRGWSSRKPRFCGERCEEATEQQQRDERRRAEEVRAERARREYESYEAGERMRYG